jgi:RNA polymerase sigma-70 factor (ECF subfamily)
MPTSVDFAGFLARIRAGDQQAAAELVEHYAPIVRRTVRLHWHLPELSRLMDSMDVCQSVLGSFFVRVAAGQYDLEQPGQLLGLLLGMARRKLAFAARKQRAQCRDCQRVKSAAVETLDPVTDDPGPCRLVEGRELLQVVRQRLTEEERRLADRRGQGLEWSAIAAELGGTPDGRRMQLTRALDRVARQLGLDEGSDA